MSFEDHIEVFRSMKKLESERRREACEVNTEVIEKLEIPHKKFSKYHFLLMGRISFWPSTEKWIDQKTGRYGRGMERLFNFMEAIEKNASTGN